MPRLRMLVLLALAGCSFDTGGVAGPGSLDGAVDGPTADAPLADAPFDGPPAAQCPVADIDLRACWRFEENLHPQQPWDESQYGNHGTSSNVTFLPGRSGLGVSVTAGSDVRVADSASLDITGTVSMDLWIHVRSLPATGRSGVLDNNGQYALFLSPIGEIRCTVGSATVIGLNIRPGTWHHVACVYDGSSILLYQDGTAGAGISYSGPITTDNDDPLTLGQDSPGGDPLDGILDTVRIWSRPLAPAEICRFAGAC